MYRLISWHYVANIIINYFIIFPPICSNNISDKHGVLIEVRPINILEYPNHKRC